MHVSAAATCCVEPSQNYSLYSSEFLRMVSNNLAGISSVIMKWPNRKLIVDKTNGQAREASVSIIKQWDLFPNNNTNNSCQYGEFSPPRTIFNAAQQLWKY